jgi:hypothetical protein
MRLCLKGGVILVIGELAHRRANAREKIGTT